MSGLHITPEMCAAMYDFLLQTPPFRAWRKRGTLPPSDEVEFHVIASNSRSGDSLRRAGGSWRIRINNKWGGTVPFLFSVMAHEMVHVHLDTECPNDVAHHGARFRRAAELVCKHHSLCSKGF